VIFVVKGVYQAYFASYFAPSFT